jgi:hypothetical protein
MSFVLANLVIFASSVANVKYRQVPEKLWLWLYLNENKMFCKVCMKAGKKNTMTIGLHNFQNRKMHVKNGPLGL